MIFVVTMYNFRRNEYTRFITTATAEAEAKQNAEDQLSRDWSVHRVVQYQGGTQEI